MCCGQELEGPRVENVQYTVYNLCKYFNLVCAPAIFFITPSLRPGSPSSVERKQNFKLLPCLVDSIKQMNGWHHLYNLYGGKEKRHFQTVKDKVYERLEGAAGASATMLFYKQSFFIFLCFSYYSIIIHFGCNFCIFFSKCRASVIKLLEMFWVVVGNRPLW